MSIDTLVATKIMGWRWIRYPSGTVTLVKQNLPNAEWHAQNCVPVDAPGPDDRVDTSLCHHYSRDLDSAWSVVESLRGLWVHISYSPYADEGMEHEKCVVNFYPIGNAEAKPVGWSVARSMPIAVCVAALRAVGVSEDLLRAEAVKA